MRTLLLCAWLFLPAGCASGSLRDAKQVLPLDRSLDVVQSIPASPETVARLLPVAARRAGWDVNITGSERDPWVLRLDWAFNSAGIWTRVVIEPDGAGSHVRYASMLRNNIDAVEDVNGNTRLLMGWVVVVVQEHLASRRGSP